ncbi:unnamed protein product [Lepeophtheirus salmonis]|uniref:(salmon louse) hypothetical protein n=1 Tax=Lepeophtheirus salmonis TaxID=72036 RepID=A0A7R8CC92_LEPSM|nr:unnamed protein product [Lepeophtheirus salmonis]CAF2766222.1 unnamed protein product [Lepeophtheirus salmonis]
MRICFYLIYAWIWVCIGPVESNLGRSETSATLIFNSGANITLNCQGKSPNRDIAWIQYGKKVLPSNRIRHESDGRLIIHKVFPRDEGLYLCQDRIRTLATWNTPLKNSDVDPPLLKYTLSYRLDGNERSEGVEDDTLSWTECKVSEDENSYTVYNLRSGENVSVMVRTTYDPKEIREAEQETGLLFSEGAPVYDGELHADAQDKINLQQDSFKVWIVALLLFVIVSTSGAIGISLFLIKVRGRSRNDITVETTEEEAMELVPHITLNPSFNIDMLEYIEPEESSINDEDGANLVSLPNG